MHQRQVRRICGTQRTKARACTKQELLLELFCHLYLPVAIGKVTVFAEEHSSHTMDAKL